MPVRFDAVMGSGGGVMRLLDPAHLQSTRQSSSGIYQAISEKMRVNESIDMCYTVIAQKGNDKKVFKTSAEAVPKTPGLFLFTDYGKKC